MGFVNFRPTRGRDINLDHWERVSCPEEPNYLDMGVPFDIFWATNSFACLFRQLRIIKSRIISIDQ